MANTILTTAQIQKEALKILEQEMADATPYSLVVVTLKDGTTQEIIIKMNPRSLYEVCDDIRKHGALTMTNEEGGIYVPAHEIKHINVMKVTKEQP
jgi:hypothetical protein